MKKISVCVPTYNRSDTLKQLINSYKKQDYPLKELIISDDSSNDAVKNLVERVNDVTIHYYRNFPALGFSQNLLKSMELASGDYIITLGDDDVLLNQSVLTQYVSIFENNKKVGFVYSNLLQFSDKLSVETLVNYSQTNRLFHKGKDSMEHMWVHSVFIGGIGVRNIKGNFQYYPSKKILHPQVEFIGNILNLCDSYILAQNNIGARSHNDQIIFRALKDRKVRQEGDHVTIELYRIFEYLKKKYNLNLSFDFIARQLIDQQMIMVFKEKSNLGNREMEKYYKNFCATSPRARSSLKFKFAYLLAKALPSYIIFFLRTVALKMVYVKNMDKHKVLKKQLLFMVANS